MVSEDTKIRGTLVLDVDDTLYRMDSGLHDAIKYRISKHANETPALRAKTKEWLGEDRDIRAEDLGTVFPKIVMAYKQQSPEDLEHYLDEVYGDDYEKIKPDPRLVGAVKDAEAEGIRVVIYSNGPSATDPMKDYHVQKVLRRLGFDDEFVDRMRGETYDLLMSVEAGAGKPSEEGMNNFLRDLKVDPSDAAFVDDGVKNLAVGIARGMKGFWVWSTSKPRAAADIALGGKLGVTQAATPAEAIESMVAGKRAFSKAFAAAVRPAPANDPAPSAPGRRLG